MCQRTEFATAGKRIPVTVVENAIPRGFGQIQRGIPFVHTPYFCVINPDVRLGSTPSGLSSVWKTLGSVW